MTHCVRWGSLTTRKEEIWGQTFSQIKAKPSVLCCHLANTNEERFRLLPNYFGHCFTSAARDRVSKIEQHIRVTDESDILHRSTQKRMSAPSVSMISGRPSRLQLPRVPGVDSKTGHRTSLHYTRDMRHFLEAFSPSVT